MYKEQRDALEKMRKANECDMERNLVHYMVDKSDKTVAVPGDRWWPQKAKQEGDKVNNAISM